MLSLVIYIYYSKYFPSNFIISNNFNEGKMKRKKKYLKNIAYIYIFKSTVISFSIYNGVIKKVYMQPIKFSYIYTNTQLWFSLVQYNKFVIRLHMENMTGETDGIRGYITSCIYSLSYLMMMGRKNQFFTFWVKKKLGFQESSLWTEIKTWAL